MTIKTPMAKALALILSVSSLHTVAMAPTPVGAAMLPQTPTPVHVTVSPNNSTSSFGMLHLALGTLTVSTTVLFYMVYKNNRALRRLEAANAVTNGNVIRLDHNLHERCNSLDANIATVNDNVQESHAVLAAQSQHANANTEHMLQQIKPGIRPLVNNTCNAQFRDLQSQGVTRAAMQELPQQRALDRALNALDSGLNSGLKFLFMAPSIAMQVTIRTCESMAKPEIRYLLEC